MKRAVLIIEILCIALIFSGCNGAVLLSSAREVEDLELVRTIGIDTEDEEIKITVNSASGTEGNAKFFSTKAETLAQAVNDMQKLPVGKEALFSHTEHIVISEDTAKNGIGEFLDYIERSNDTRIDTNFFITRGISAEELLVKASGEDLDISDILTFMTENIELLGNGCVFTCRDIASALSTRGCGLIQAISVSDSEGLYEGEAEKTAFPDGFAVIKDSKLIGFISDDEASGAMLLMNKTKSDDIKLEHDGATVSVILNGNKAKFTPVFSGSELKEIKAEVEISANITSVSEMLNIYDDDVREALAAQLEDIELSRVTAALSAAQRMDADFMGISKEIELKSPLKCAEIVENWGEIFKDIDFNVSVDCEIRRTFDINDHVNTDGEETISIWKTEIK